ncbi:hypothetical protein ALC56_03222 [Trachymyrmex septentrionalis]|uniref:Uncharacterized protein n=1 Tax=Trachymyrmex septentrionalis TaxID=34720 RepID=A0A195FQ89_9HYME|nr:hypothetical protein ALC56_03222 [Trachymyrmex septentrionalis]
MTRTEKERQEGRPPAKKVPRFRTKPALVYPSSPDPRGLTWPPGPPPPLHRLVRLILSGKQTSGSREVRCE